MIQFMSMISADWKRLSTRFAHRENVSKIADFDTKRGHYSFGPTPLDIRKVAAYNASLS